MYLFRLTPFVLLAACATPKQVAAPVVDRTKLSQEVASELDDVHATASRGEEIRYLAHFAKDAVFLGTDAIERWDLPTFSDFVHAHFAKGKGWTYAVKRRAITLSPDASIAWFDEDLMGEKVGETRGSGVLVRTNGRYLIAQYNLAFTVPNDRFTEFKKSLLPPDPLAQTREWQQRAYKTATEAASRGDLAQARDSLSAVVPDARKFLNEDMEFWIHNQLTWIHWAMDDLPGALAEVDAAGAAIDRSQLPDAKKTSLRLHERWDRAYLLLELAMREPANKRSLAAATAAHAAYNELAGPANDHDGAAVLDAFFLTRTGKGKEAAVAARRVDVEHDADLQDLYVLALAFDAAGERAVAEAINERIRGGQDYLMKPLLLREMNRAVAKKTSKPKVF